MPGGSLNFPPPQAAVRKSKLHIAKKQNGCSGVDSLIFLVFPFWTRRPARSQSCAFTIPAGFLLAQDHTSNGENA
jgi:hypothetical protein